MRVFIAPAVLVTALAAALASAVPHHRLHRPPIPLARSLSVDESEWSIVPSQRMVAAGTVTLHVYNRGMDEHNLTIKGPGGIRGVIWLQSGQSGTIVAHLRRGTYMLYCSMFMGTPQSHYMMGMHTVLTAR